MVPITRLSDNCLLALFKQLPPADQLCAGKVCRKWASLVLEVTQRRRHLVLLVGDHSLGRFSYDVDIASNRAIKQYIIGDDGQPMYRPAHFHTPTIWNSLLVGCCFTSGYLIDPEIASIFPNITNLELSTFEANHDWQGLTDLLLAWRSGLTSFKLFINTSAFVKAVALKVQLAAFFDAMNSLSGLKHLTLFLNYIYCPMLPILATLEEFFFESAIYTPQKCLIASLAQYAETNTTLRRIDLGVDPEPFFDLSDALRDRFTRIDRTYQSATRRVPAILAYFPALTTIGVHCPISVRQLLATLSKLPNLLFLQLRVFFRELRKEDAKAQYIPMPQLMKVKALRLLIGGMTFHDEFDQLKLEWTLPHLQVLKISIDDHCKCTNCQIWSWAGAMETNPALIVGCYRLITEQLKGCTELRKILFDREVELAEAIEELMVD